MYRGHVDLEHPLFWVVDDFLDASECARWVERIESAPREVATINAPGGHVLRTDVRNNTRVIVDDEPYATSLWPRARPHVPAEMFQRVACGLNERFRCYRYERGQRFAPHFDGSFTRDEREASELTLIVYLNEGMEGGGTALLDLEEVVEPRVGRALFFQHRLLHEGSLVHAGLKYVLRTDVMYRDPD